MTWKDYNDDWFINNGYLKVNYDRSAPHIYRIITSTEKFKKLFETSIKLTGSNHLITPDILQKVIEDGSAERRKRSTYKKVYREKGYKTVKQRKELNKQKKLDKKSKVTNVNRNIK